MKYNKYLYSSIGLSHHNHNEDYAFIEETDHHLILAVMDGCSSGNESYFSSALMAKILRKAINEVAYLSFVEKRKFSEKEVLKAIVKKLFNDLGTIKNQLLLSNYTPKNHAEWKFKVFVYKK